MREMLEAIAMALEEMGFEVHRNTLSDDPRLSIDITDVDYCVLRIKGGWLTINRFCEACDDECDPDCCSKYAGSYPVFLLGDPDMLIHLEIFLRVG